MPTETIGPGAYNRAFRTEELNNQTYWTHGQGLTTNNNIGGEGTAPDGTETAERLNATGGTLSFIYRDFTSLPDTSVWTGSIHVKNDGTNPSVSSFLTLSYTAGASQDRRDIRINWNFSGPPTIFFRNLTADDYLLRGPSDSIWMEDAGNGWWRVGSTITIDTAIGSTIRMEFQPDRLSNNDSVYAWGVQFEERWFMSPYQSNSESDGSDPYLGDYTTIASWLSSTDADLVTTTTQYTGQLLDGVHEADFGTLEADIPIGDTSSVYNRRLTAAPGAEYVPWSNSGAKINLIYSGGSVTEDGLVIDEEYFELDNIGIFADNRNGPIGGTKRLLKIERSNCQVNSCYVQAAQSGRNPSTGPLVTCIEVDGLNGSNIASDVYLYNVIVQGSRDLRGASAGVVFGSFVLLGGCYNCAAYNFHNSTAPRGFLSSDTGVRANQPELVNNVALNIGTLGTINCFSGFWSVFLNNVSWDSSAIGTGITAVGAPADPASKAGINAESCWLAPDQRDFRIRFGSPLQNDGSDEDIQFLSSDGPGNNQDFLGNSRTGLSWDIGPLEGVYPFQNTTSPTEVLSAVGFGRDYSTLHGWVGALPDSLYTANESHIAELYADTDYSSAETLRVYNHVTDRIRNIEFRAATGQEFNPIGGFHGAVLQGDTTDQVVDIRNEYVTIKNIGFEQLSASASSRQVLRLDGQNLVLDGVVGRQASGTGSSNTVFDVQGNRMTMRNCIALGSTTSSQGAVYGIFINRGATIVNVYHCGVYNIQGNLAATFGVGLNAEITRSRISGCWVGAVSGASSNDFSLHPTLVDEAILDHCASEDTTALGTGSLISQTIANLVNNATNLDFRLSAGSALLNAGALLATEFKLDLSKKTRISPFDIGPYEGIASAPLLAPAHRGNVMRAITCYDIFRSDGVGLFFTTSNEPVTHAGQIYEPMGGILTAARREEGGLKEHSSEIVGAITSDKITQDDLEAGRYDTARVREFVIDWLVPFAAPWIERTYLLDQATYDGESWRAEVVGPSSALEKRTGSILSVSCRVALGSAACGVDLDDLTEFNLSVTGVTAGEERREFECTGIESGRVDDYFGLGIALFLTGNNAALSFRVKNYTQSGTTVRLELQTPFDIEVGDTLNLVPGCRKRLVADCTTKYANAINHRGYALKPSSDAILDAPSS